MLFPDFLTFLANNAALGVLVLVAWVVIVGIVVWLVEKAVEKFRRHLSRTATQADASVSSVAALEPASAGEQASARRKPGVEPEAAE
jgi:uncharacterized membrane protein YdfJ with MMPL/SSD domain